ncbi:hypothetical protein HF086_017675 [Spodoptera exigua]|uniref:Peptidase S1 domain-containing protein n=1 Tax=Spodoptera exigua TaxID=7107 RepID=A0A922MGX5_SPOEX|nr:hypothetical protein HF086_017675 [Spodoptera exigua]
MVTFQFNIAIILNIIFVSNCTRRIKDGATVTTTKRYVAYLVKAPLSVKLYDSWVCGGAIVSSLYIITSAACVDDVEYLYAIAGYKKYVPDKDIETDQCTKTMKKKVIYTCVPVKYELNYHQVEKWSYIDIAIVKVESPFDFNDSKYETLCSYKPKVIGVNYEQRFQESGIDALQGDTNNYNQGSLRYAAVKIIDKALCKNEYKSFPNMSNVIDEFMICTEGKGELDENGNLVLCEEDNVQLIVDKTRREVLRSTNKTSDHPKNNAKNGTQPRRRIITRKSGICQNDHGGPLVTWVGANEVLIGVASVFKVTSTSKCTGPYLYTSTRCNGMFLHCILSSKRRRRSICDSPPIQRAYELKYEEIEKWSYIDIAVVKVESPYDFQDKSFAELCSYIPVPIIINYETKYQEPGVDGIVLGWGHQSKWRQLHYAPILIQNKEDCKKEYAVYKGMDQVIDKYMICTFEKGNINDAGETIVKAPPRAQGCKFSPNGLRTFDGVSCENVNSLGDDMDLVENTRKNNGLLNNRTANAKVDKKSNNVNNKIMNGSTVEKGSLNINNLGRMNTRRNGICQNDHGGPMVTWVGAHEVLIGVASVFKITEALECIGPYLFTSTQCNGAFLDCILRSDPEKTDTMRRAICDNATSAGFELIEKKISWKHHPDG